MPLRRPGSQARPHPQDRSKQPLIERALTNQRFHLQTIFHTRARDAWPIIIMGSSATLALQTRAARVAGPPSTELLSWSLEVKTSSMGGRKRNAGGLTDQRWVHHQLSRNSRQGPKPLAAIDHKLDLTVRNCIRLTQLYECLPY